MFNNTLTGIYCGATGSPWNFSPILDVGRQQLWSRLYETMGEDVHVVLKMSSAYIKGHQGTNNKEYRNNTKKAATCMKHYIGYSYPFNGKDRTNTLLPEYLLREYFLPSFQNAIKMGSPTVMANSAHVNGIPGHANHYLLTDVLKKELGFEGFVISDWEDIKRLYTRDKVAESPEDAVRIAVMAGIDMSMVPFDFSFTDYCINLTKKDPLFTERVNDAVKRILKVKDDMGLFENPFPDPNTIENVDKDESFDFNLEAAKESIILAKNENNILPIKLETNENFEEKKERIIVAGPTANLIRVLNGGWSLGNEGEYHMYGRPRLSVFESMKRTAKDSFFSIEFIEGANLTHLTNTSDLLDAVKDPNVKYIFLCIGEDIYSETAGNIDNIELHQHQLDLISAVIRNKQSANIIMIYLGGRPRVIPSNIIEQIPVFIIGFLPGDRGAEAISDIIFGLHNPSGKLPITYPSSPNSLITYDYQSRFEDISDLSLYEFGHGLSYTDFVYSNLVLNTSIVEVTSFNGCKEHGSSVISGSVNVKNDGKLAGKETILVYLSDEYASVTRPRKQLKFFTKVNIEPDQTINIKFSFDLYDMSFINTKNERICESGTFVVYVSDSDAHFTLQIKN